MAFDLFLALVPLLALGGWVVSLVLKGDQTTMNNLSALLDLAPNDVRRVINQHAERFNGRAIAPIAFVGSIWLGSGAFDTVMAAFERTAPSDPRPWWVRRGIAIISVPCFLSGLSLGAWLALNVTGLPSGLDELVHQLAPPSTHLDTTKVIGFVVSTATVTLMVAAFFRLGVRRDVPKRVVWPGTALTLAIGSLASYGFATYASYIARYAFYYGSLAAVAVLLAWLWICSLALLVGAELNVYLEEQIAAVSNRLPPPLGQARRGSSPPAGTRRKSHEPDSTDVAPKIQSSPSADSTSTHSPTPSGKPPTP